MALADYTDLLASVETWLGSVGDTDLSGSAADFITLAEERINRGAGDPFPSPPLRLQAMETVDPAFSVSAEYTAVPADFLEMRRLVLPTNPPQLVPVVSEEQIIALFGGMTGTNYTVAVVGLQLQIRPVITVAQLFELVYVAKVPALTAIAPTNWLLTNAPSLYLYGSLLSAAIYIDEDADVQRFGALYQSAAAGLQASDRRSRFAGSVLQARVHAVTP